MIFAFGKNVKKGEKILLKVSLSFTGFNGAQKNSSEIKGWDFEKVIYYMKAAGLKFVDSLNKTEEGKDKRKEKSGTIKIRTKNFKRNCHDRSFNEKDENKNNERWKGNGEGKQRQKGGKKNELKGFCYDFLRNKQL